ncbi:MAG: HEAT repeat domain-containing protein [Planctomycetota bacterium]|nr:HEAT repeat domain-containing protein [Planctomycetota bacterium]
MRTIATTYLLCWSVASSIAMQVAPEDDPLIFDKRLRQWTQLLADETPEVRYRAASSLGQIGPKANAAVAAVIEALKDDNKVVRRLADRALPRIGAQARDVPALIEAFQRVRGDYEGGSGVAETLGDIGPEARDALPVLKERPGIWSAYAIVQIDPGDESAIRYLVDQLDNFEGRHVFTRKEILRALGRIGPRAHAALPALKQMMLDEDQRLRMEVAYVVARVDPDDKKALHLLLTSLEGLNPDNLAAKMLGRLPSQAEASVPALIKAHHTANNRDDLIRYYIAEALGEIGPKATTALPLLRDLLTHSSPRVREAAAVAIYKIEMH